MSDSTAAREGTKKLTVQFPSQGWKQIRTARKEMLDAYDKARDQARAHEVETYQRCPAPILRSTADYRIPT